MDRWPCPAYLLPDGKTVVDPVLFERVQEKINSQKRTGGAGQTKHAMTGLLRCGVCGQGLTQSAAVVKMKNEAETYTYPYWRIVRHEGWCWCSHTMPGIRADALDAYLDHPAHKAVYDRYLGRMIAERGAVQLPIERGSFE